MRALVLLLVAALAGCSSAEPDAPGASQATQAPSGSGGSAPVAASALGADTSFAFGPPVIIGPGAAEASLAFAPDGTMLACTHGGFTGPSPVFVSEDFGVTWRPGDPPMNPLPSGDCDVSIGPDGSWYVAFDTLASATVSVSHDRGETWLTTFSGALPVGGVDRPWLQATRTGVYMTYCDIMGVEPAVCLFATSPDGVVWTKHHLLVGPDGAERSHAVTGRLWTSEDGRAIRVPVFSFNGAVADPDGWLFSYTSSDAGATWEQELVAGPVKTPPQFPSVSVDDEGTAWFSFAVMNGTEAPPGAAANVGWIEPLVVDIMLASQPAGRAWEAPSVVAPAQRFDTVASTWVSGAARGAVVAWDAMTGDAQWQVRAARLTPGAAAVLTAVTEETPSFAGVDFLQVWHENGRAMVVYVMASDDCEADIGPGECIFLAREA